ncbi:hypothetical protein ACFWJY_00090 [Streptomyces anulatus]|uniref:hypothetical protein n=1 Tax=Streptomyces anulatus TaxID=1892 RepID=UPI00366782AC
MRWSASPSGGEPHFPTPEHVVIAAAETLRSGFTHYTPSRGISQLREASAAKPLQNNRIVADPGTDIIVTPSARHAARIALAGVIGPATRCWCPHPPGSATPRWSPCSAGVRIDVLLDPRDDFTISAEQLPSAAGSASGPTAEQHVRLSFAASTDILATPVERLEAAPGRRAPASHRPTGTTSRLRARDRDIKQGSSGRAR